MWWSIHDAGLNPILEILERIRAITLPPTKMQLSEPFTFGGNTLETGKGPSIPRDGWFTPGQDSHMPVLGRVLHAACLLSDELAYLGVKQMYQSMMQVPSLFEVLKFCKTCRYCPDCPLGDGAW